MGQKLLFVLGTRPEIIKLAPVIRTVDETKGLSMRIVHTGQHYDDELSDVFFRTLDLPSPDSILNVGSGTQGEQTAEGLRKIEGVIAETSPTSVVALGDTNAVLSAALATSKMSPRFAHIEAGIRSFDRTMPEEVNRVVADRVADLSFAPTDIAVKQLADEGITTNVWNVGNTIVDACLEHVPLARDRSTVLDRLGLKKECYAVATIHRERNTDNERRLRAIVEALDEQQFPVIFPTHPRTRDALERMEFEPRGSLRLIEPVDYLDFLALLVNSYVVVTDSGGIQEEASILEIPCLTVRPNTERPETIEARVNELLSPSALHDRLETVFVNEDVHQSMTGHPHLYGDGTAAEQIVDILQIEL